MNDAPGYYIGHHNSTRSPEAVIVVEQKHPKGGWLSVFTDQFNHSYYVGHRDTRLIKFLTLIPHRQFSVSGEPMNVESFASETAAREYLSELVSNPRHDRVPEPVWTAPVRDPQKEKVYEWEDEFCCPHIPLPRDQVIALIHKIETDIPVGLNSINIELDATECCLSGYRTIRLAPFGMNAPFVIHEMAHWVTWNYYRVDDDRVAAHGPEFVGVLMLMLTHYHGVVLTDMINAAIQQKIKFVFPNGGLITLMTARKK